ncbi:MAG TPA: SbmA/BacA-like family transporter [Roseiarcus sp.]|jgi:putative ATP-binding cassette transporter|nr:SbmA/BacA-like family transporter [Roseiarcus sp.]
MEPEKPPPLNVTATRLARAVAVFANSEAGRKAKWLFAALLVLLLAANGLTVVNSFVGRNFMTAIADRREAEFARLAILYVGVFAASTIVAVVARFAEERLGLQWRDSLTREMLKLYLANGAYSRLASFGEVANPDQRIAEDVRALTASTLSFALMAFNSVVTILAFAGVMFSISLVLSAVAVLYAALGSLAILLLGRPLIKRNSDQLDKEASFRAALIHVKENAQSILLARQENAQSARLLRRLDELIANGGSIIAVNRRVGFFTTGYNWMIQIIPVLIMAPAYIAGQIEFGVVTQSAGAFATAVAAFSLVVNQFQSLSALAAVMARLNSMAEAVDPPEPRPSAIQVVESEYGGSARHPLGPICPSLPIFMHRPLDWTSADKASYENGSALSESFWADVRGRFVQASPQALHDLASCRGHLGFPTAWSICGAPLRARCATGWSSPSEISMPR